MICTQLDNVRAKIYGKYIVSMKCEVQHNMWACQVLIPSVKLRCASLSVSAHQHQLVPDMTKPTRGEPPQTHMQHIFSIWVSMVN